MTLKQWFIKTTLKGSLTLFFFLGLLAGCSEKSKDNEAKPPQEAIAVLLRPTRVQPLQRSIQVVGTLFGDEEPTISTKVTGRITHIFKDIGDRAMPGEALAEIDKTDYELAKTQREMAMRESLAKLGLESLPGDSFDPGAIPTVERTRLQVANAQAKYNRGKQLFEQTPPLISEQDYADLQTAYDVAQSNLAVERLTVQALLAEAKIRKSELDLAVQQLKDTTVRAPQTQQNRPTTAPATQTAGGRFAIAARLGSVGEYFQEGSPLFRLVADHPIKYRADVPEQFMDQVEVGQQVRISVDAYSDEFIGRIARISPQVNAANRTFQIEVEVPNHNGLLKPGSFARGSVLTAIEPNVTFVPAESIASFAGVNKVFTVKDGKAVEAIVQPGVRLGDYVEIIQGLAGSQEVVVTGKDNLANGTPVTISSPAEPGSQTTQPADPQSPASG